MKNFIAQNIVMIVALLPIIMWCGEFGVTEEFARMEGMIFARIANHSLNLLSESDDDQFAEQSSVDTAQQPLKQNNVNFLAQDDAQDSLLHSTILTFPSTVSVEDGFSMLSRKQPRPKKSMTQS